jgi:hypothetical protein
MSSQDGKTNVKANDSDSDVEILDSKDPEYHAKEIARKFKQRCKAFKK